MQNMKEEDVNRCQIQEWYPNFKSVSVKTIIHQLPESFIQYLLDDSGPFLLPVSVLNEDALPNRIHNPIDEEDFQVSEGSDDDEADESSPPPSFPELELQVKESIESLGGSVFPKLNWSAPKDSAWISTSATLRCTTFSEIALLFRASDSLVHDLCHAYDSCQDKSSSRPHNFFLALRKWYPSLKPEMEFRCFVRNHKLIGISQREVTTFYPVLVEKKDDLLLQIQGFFNNCVRTKFELENYAFDIYVTNNERVKIVDFNTWGGFTLSLLFTWDELEHIHSEEEDDVEFRIVEDRCGVRPGLKTAVPYDYLDTSSGSGWDQFLRNADEELRQQSRSTEAATQRKTLILRRRNRRRKKSKAMSDRISRLQDEILCHILSFVTTKEAVATSVLSKRWTHLWIYVPNIDFNISVDNSRSNYKFNESVYSVLASRDAVGSNVDSFRLDIEYGNPHLGHNCGFPNIVRWINLVVQRKLKHLYLHLYFGKYDDDDLDEDVSLPKLPISIFTCKTLVSLNLYRFHVEGFSFSSIGFGFPSLKTLILEDIDFSKGRDFLLLLSGCPNLEDLQLYDMFFTFANDHLALQEFKSLSLPKLTRADISPHFWFVFPLKALSTSKPTCLDTLKLYAKDHEVVEVNQLQRLYSDIRIFHNLTYLQLQLTNSYDLVVQVLHHCPKLQDLELYKEPACTIDQKNLVEPEFVPHCLSSYLTTCTILNMGGQQSELMVATFILKNARILQTMEIWTQREQEQPEIERKLFQCPKASATCQLLVY